MPLVTLNNIVDSCFSVFINDLIGYTGVDCSMSDGSLTTTNVNANDTTSISTSSSSMLNATDATSMTSEESMTDMMIVVDKGDIGMRLQAAFRGDVNEISTALFILTDVALSLDNHVGY